MEIAIIAAFILSGLWGLARGGDWLVEGAAELARRFGVSSLVIGLTVVALGTSAPELVLSGVAAYQDQVSMALGNVLGSNIANLGLVLGFSCLILPVVLGKPIGVRELFWLFGSLGLFWRLSLDGVLSQNDGGILLGSSALYIVHMLISSRGPKTEGDVEEPEPEKEVRRPWLSLLLGTIALAVGAQLVVKGGVRLGALLNVSEHIIALTLFAVGTSLPELAASIAGARSGEGDLSLGNVVGSNVLNLLAVLGTVALIRPIQLVTDAGVVQAHPALTEAIERDAPLTLGFSVAVALLCLVGFGGRAKGALLLLAYSGFVWYACTSG